MTRTRFVVLGMLWSLATTLQLSGVHAEDKPPRILPGWGEVVDLDGDCKFDATPEKLTIQVPPGQHNLHPMYGFAAPRVVRKVSGDFTAQVKVTSDLNPTRFFGAGILLWDNNECYLRVERDAFINGETVNCYPPLIEYWKDKKYSGFNDDVIEAKYFVGRSTWFRVERRERNITVSISHDGVVWIEVKTVEVNMSQELMVGVAAVSVSKTPFTAVFEDLTIKEAKPKAAAGAAATPQDKRP